jgi:amidophosphoribosyltransferase
MRDFAVKIKYNPVRELLRGKRVVVVDDSIVRGSTSQKLMRMIRRAGAKEIHLRVGSPPIRFPCGYGIDTPTRKELIASSHTVKEIAHHIGVDSLGYLSVKGMLEAAPLPASEFCVACFQGNYIEGFGGEADKLSMEREPCAPEPQSQPRGPARQTDRRRGVEEQR